MIISNIDFCKDFNKCDTLYKDFLKQFNSTQSETRRVSEVSAGGRGRSGGKNIEDRYYTKDKYSKISRDHRLELPVIHYHRIRVNHPYPCLGVL